MSAPGERGYARTTASMLWSAGVVFGITCIALDRNGWGWRVVVGGVAALAVYVWCLSRSDRHDEANEAKARARLRCDFT